MFENTLIRPENLMLSSEQLAALAPLFWVFGGGILTIVLSVLRWLSPKWPVFLASVATATIGIWSSLGTISGGKVLLFNNMLVVDPYSSIFSVLFLASALLTLFASLRYLDQEWLQHPEYYVLVLFSALGMMLMASSLDLIVLFIALELMSLAIYCLVGFRRADRRSNEAAVKYFVLGAAASAVLLYGAALLYGATGSTNIVDVLAHVTRGVELTPVFVLGAWLVILGFLFKVASVPFHMWMPDVYEGAPTPITGFMTTGLKAAAFAAFVRVFVSLGYGEGLSDTVQSHLHDILWVSAVLTMVVGNVIALTQNNLKRMLAYSSIAHTGYLLVGVIAGSAGPQGYAPVVLYLISYAIMNIGAFVVLTMLSQKEDRGLGLSDLSGLASRHPWLAFALSVFLFSMAGVPPTAGFAAKYLLLYGAVQAGEVPLVVIAVLCSAISVYYYLKVLVYMYMRDPAGAPGVVRHSGWAALAVASSVALTVQIGVLPARMVEVAKKAVTSL
jgi:NADH-quinone oxidoreductase subunit N